MDNEKILNWLDQLRDGVANHNSTAEELARKAMATVKHTHVNNHTDDNCQRCGRDIRDTFVHLTAEDWHAI